MGEINIQDYLEGKSLYGDDFTIGEINQWYADEMNGYADLGSKESERYSYKYHAINIIHGFSSLNIEMFDRILGFGAAYGHEIEPVRDKVGELFILDPSPDLKSDMLYGIKVNHQSPKPSGKLDYPDDYFNLITCFGTLHHIANVSTVVRELARTLKPGGILLMREPIISMGDWRYPRKGLTKHERGIPVDLLKSMVKNSGLRIRKKNYCFFPVTRRLGAFFRYPVYNKRWTVRIDQVLSWMFRWNIRYHRTKKFHMLAPDSVFLVLEKESFWGKA